jgi:dolichol-phosphate mannosyltransferase
MSFNWERAPIARSPISAVVPVYRNAATVTSVVEALVQELKSLDRLFEILLIDDASPDETSTKLKELAQRFSQVKVLRHDTHQGQGAALRTGITAAQHPLLFTLTADGSYPPVVLHQLLGHIDEVDIVVGVRRGISWWHRFTDSWRGKLFLGLHVKDPACPLRLYRKSVFEKLPIQSHGVFAHQEILGKATFLECIVTEVEVNWEPKPAPSDQPSPGKDFRRVFFRPAFGPPPQVPVTPVPSTS